MSTYTSSSSYSFGFTPPSVPPIREIVRVGNEEITDKMSAIFKKCQCNVIAKTGCLWQETSNHEEEHYMRDTQVRNFDGINFITTFFRDNEAFREQFTAALHPDFVLFIKNPKNAKSGWGRGLEPKNVEAAIKRCIRETQPFYRARCIIEGGNAFFLYGNKVIVGSTSWTLTFLRVKEAIDSGEHTFFTKEDKEWLEQMKVEIIEPKQEFIYIARNMHLNQQKIEAENKLEGLWTLLEKQPNNKDLTRQVIQQRFEIKNKFGKTEEEFIDKLIVPVTNNDLLLFKKEACLVQAQFGLAKKIMADSLRVDVKNLLIIPHEDFHIDMAMNVFPGGVRVMLDRSMEWAKTVIENIGCKVIIVDGIQNVDKREINFMNGIFVPTSKSLLYVTNSCAPEDLKFFTKFQKQLEPYCEVVSIAGTEEMARDADAGIHCITCEEEDFQGVHPVNIIRSYLADAPYSREQLQIAISEALLPHFWNLAQAKVIS